MNISSLVRKGRTRAFVTTDFVLELKNTILFILKIMIIILIEMIEMITWLIMTKKIMRIIKKNLCLSGKMKYIFEIS